MWQLLQRLARTPVLNVVRRAGTYERPPPDVVTQFTTQVKEHPEVLPVLGIIVFPTGWAIYHNYLASRRADTTCPCVLDGNTTCPRVLDGNTTCPRVLDDGQRRKSGSSVASDIPFNKWRREISSYEEFESNQETKLSISRYSMSCVQVLPSPDQEAIRDAMVKDDVPKRP
ncbi:hypothetical protein BsWGS_11322 [Bradybaena similaris]